MAVEIPAEMLARLPEAAFDAVERQHVLVVRDDVVGELGRRAGMSLADAPAAARAIAPAAHGAP